MSHVPFTCNWRDEICYSLNVYLSDCYGLYQEHQMMNVAGGSFSSLFDAQDILVRCEETCDFNTRCVAFEVDWYTHQCWLHYNSSAAMMPADYNVTHYQRHVDCQAYNQCKN